jgi:RNA polymerase sigma-70 factor (ECF subfamily)
MSAPEHREEKALVERMLAGDERAMETFGDLYFAPLYRFARARLHGDGELARDIVQTTVCKALGKLDSYRGDGPLLGWLYACCRNELRMHFRRTRLFPELALGAEDDEVDPGLVAGSRLDEPSPEGRLLERETGELVHETLDRLPPHYARALEWKYLERLSVNDIAERLRLGPKAAESLLTRARSAFRNAYDRLRAAPPAAADPLPFATSRTPRS